MKAKKSVISAVLALSIVCSICFGVITQSGCGNLGSNTNNEQSETIYYNLKLNLNGGELAEDENATKFEAGKRFILPKPTKIGYSFLGWFDNAEFSGNAYSQIDKFEATSDKEFWAKWEVEVLTYKVTLHFNIGNLKDGEINVTSYKYGTAVTLPELERDGYNFEGWYEDKNFGGSPVTKISATDKGNKEYYAKWSAVGGGSDVTPQKYSVTFNFNYEGAPAPTVVDVELGKMVAKITPSREGYEFLGWFEGTNGSNEYNFSSGVTKSFTLYAHWQAKTYTVTLNYNGGTILSGTDIKSYTYGEGATLPVLEKDECVFGGWYESDTFDGNKVTEISKTDIGNKTYYAKWTKVEVTAINVTSFGGYEEGAYIVLDKLQDTVPADYSVYYRLSTSGATDYTEIDSQLVREIEDNSIRADVVGLSAGNYDLKISVGGKFVEKKQIKVTAYDRSGYAHFNFEKGVGAYNDDGTVKSGAQIVYVTEETKNTVTATLDNSTYTGIAKILQNAGKSNNPLVVRVIGTISAATWNEIDYNKSQISPSDVVGVNKKQLSRQDWSQDELIRGGYNSLNTDYTELNNLTSKIKWDSSKNEFDSYWNMCDISEAKNVTVEGIGTDARLLQWGFTWKKCNSIEVRNLTFEDYTEDACSFEGSVNSLTAIDFDSANLWVHHNTFLEGKNYWDVCNEQDKHEGDGATDFKRNSNITLSYNHYVENHKTGLIGGGDDQTTANVTFHHNWYEKCNSRLPLGREANMHIYNNFYDGTTGTNMSLRAGAYALIENCYFKNANSPITTQEGNNPDKSQKIRGVAKVVNCTFDGCAIGSTYINNKTVYNFSSNTANRATIVDNDNIFNKSFDTDPSAFYYNVTYNKSDVTRLDGKNTVPQVVKELSGVHKN